MKFLFLIINIFFISINLNAETNTDQWKDTKKTYKDLILEGYDVKSYDTNTINIDGDLMILLFITVLQKNKNVFECQEYQTIDKNMNTLDMSLVCRELVQPFTRGLGA